MMDKDTHKNNFLDNLNHEQRQAVEHGRGPALILAGPGTGKTATLTARVSALIRDKKAPPDNILAVTFTNKAADQMRRKLRTACEDDAVSRVTVATFHGFGLSLLKEYHHHAQRTARFAVIDEQEKQQVLRSLCPDRKKEIRSLSALITGLKQNITVPGNAACPDDAVFSDYEDFLARHDLFDLDDLIYRPVLVLTANTSLCGTLRKKFQWLLIDEYQDINHAQYRLIRLLAPPPDANIFAIGDPHQAIYGFRGADVSFIRSFRDDYSGAVVYSLSKSYRCSQTILSASHTVLAPNSGQCLLRGMDEGVKIKINSYPSGRSEAESIARTVQQMMGGLSFFALDSKVSRGQGEEGIHSLSDFAVLCRTKAQMAAIEKAFTDHGIPFQTVGGTSLFAQDVLRSLVTLIKYSRSPGNTFLKDQAEEITGVSPLSGEDIEQLIEGSTITDTLAALADKYLPGREIRCAPFFHSLQEICSGLDNDLDAFLRLASLGTAQDTYLPRTEQAAIMTLHAAKGLEFPCVFIPGCEQGLLPYSLFKDRETDVEEERRLLYVGMTRAKKFLFLSHAEKRFLTGRQYCLARSTFLDSIEQELIEHSRIEVKKKKKKREDDQLSLF